MYVKSCARGGRGGQNTDAGGGPRQALNEQLLPAYPIDPPLADGKGAKSCGCTMQMPALARVSPRSWTPRQQLPPLNVLAHRSPRGNHLRPSVYRPARARTRPLVPARAGTQYNARAGTVCCGTKRERKRCPVQGTWRERCEVSSQGTQNGVSGVVRRKYRFSGRGRTPPLV